LVKTPALEKKTPKIAVTKIEAVVPDARNPHQVSLIAISRDME